MHRHCLELFFSGVSFEFEGPPGLLECLALALAGPRPLGALGCSGEDAFARVLCQVEELQDAELREHTERLAQTRNLTMELGAEGARAQTRGATARVLRGAGPGAQKVVAARLQRTPQAARELLELLVCLLAQHLGGLVLHAAAVELDKGVVAFVGPSGAGKSTACQHVGEARLFSADRLAVVPRAQALGVTAHRTRGGWSAHPLPGGSALANPLPHSLASAGPLLGILRIQKAAEGHRFDTWVGGRAVGLLRQSAFKLGPGRELELELLTALERLAREVKVGELHFALGAALNRPLSAWLALSHYRTALGPGERLAADSRLGRGAT